MSDDAKKPDAPGLPAFPPPTREVPVKPGAAAPEAGAGAPAPSTAPPPPAPAPPATAPVAIATAPAATPPPVVSPEPLPEPEPVPEPEPALEPEPLPEPEPVPALDEALLSELTAEEAAPEPFAPTVKISLEADTPPAPAADAPAVETGSAPEAAAPPGSEPAAGAAPLEVLVHAVEAAATRRIALLLAVVSLVMVLFHLQSGSRENANTGSRYATVESLVESGTYNIDKTHYLFTPDKVKARDHFVSSKPPLLPTYGAGVYWVLKKLTGYTIADNEGVVVWTVSLFTGWLGHLVFLLYFYRFCRLVLVRQLAILGAMAAACFAYLGVAYATAINNHSPGATLAMVGFYHAYRARHENRTASYLFAGFWLGILPAVDLSSAAVTAFAALYLVARNWRRTLLLYVPLTLPGILSQLLLAHHATGSWIPAYADTGLMHYAGSYFGGRRSGIDALFEPKPVYAFHVLLGHHGLFSMTPIFFFSMYELLRRLVRRDRFFAEAAVFSATVFVVCAFYIYRTHNYGGWCVGMRWFVPFMPWLVLGFGLFLERAVLGRIGWAAVVLAFAISAFNVQDGLTSPFQFSLWHNFLDGEPNRNRLGPKWNLGRPSAPKKPKAPARPPPHPPGAKP